MKKRFIVFMSLLFITSQCYSADTSKIEVRGTVNDGTAVVQDTNDLVKVFTSGARQQQSVNLPASTFTNISVPQTADAVLIDVGTNTGLKLKGVTGDTGISLDSACPVLLPLSHDDATVTLGILNAGSSNKTVRVYWF